MKSIGIRQADGSFYPILEEGQTSKKTLGLTTAKDNQTRVIVDMYRSADGNMAEAEYVDSLQIDNLVKHPNGSAEIRLNIGLDENGKLTAELIDPETGATSNANVTLVSRTLEERLGTSSDDTGAFASGAVAGAAAAVAGGGLLKAAMEKESSEEVAAEETTEISEGEESFDLPADEPVSETASDDSVFELPDFDTDVSMPSFDDGDKNDEVSEKIDEETVSDEPVEESVALDMPEESSRRGSVLHTLGAAARDSGFAASSSARDKRGRASQHP